MSDAKCQRCGSARILLGCGKSSDMNGHSIAGGRDYQGYVPHVENLGGGDYWEHRICLDCGQAQGEWPQPTPEVLLPDPDGAWAARTNEDA